MKDDSGAYAVFTEQGSSASQMIAAKVVHVIARLPGCDGQAADKVSAYTQVKMERTLQNRSEFQSQNVQIYGYVSTTQMAKTLVKHRRPSGSLRTKIVRTPASRTLVGKKF